MSSAPIPNDEAFRTAYGLIAALENGDGGGFLLLWEETEHQANVALALASAGVQYVHLLAEMDGVTVQEILDRLRSA